METQVQLWNDILCSSYSLTAILVYYAIRTMSTTLRHAVKWMPPNENISLRKKVTWFVCESASELIHNKMRNEDYSHRVLMKLILLNRHNREERENRKQYHCCMLDSACSIIHEKSNNGKRIGEKDDITKISIHLNGGKYTQCLYTRPEEHTFFILYLPYL